MPTVPRALLLDAMGTLVKLEPPAPRLRSELWRRFGVRLSDAEAVRALVAEIAFYRAHMLEAGDPASLVALRAACAGVLREALPADRGLAKVGLGPLSEALVACLRFTPYVDAPAALAHARERGLRIIVVSNWDCSLGSVLDDAGLGAWLDGVVTSAQVGAAKPAGRIFAAALELAAVDAEQAVHVGDSVSEDVAGARAAGLTAVWLDRTGGPEPAGVPTLASLGELGRFI
ncbi:MAG: HAD-IA family hydrolase [Actinomycetota bacterium]|nr:HAD-IA family hydrolase [Actinomycetota bacterium]